MWPVRYTRRQLRALLYTILLCLVIGLWTIVSHELSRDHYISTDLVDFSSNFEAGGQVLLSPNDIESTCRAHGFAPGKTQTSKRKIYDLVLMSTELDWLEIRLHTLSHYVDYFVIIESPTTFTGKPKPLHLRDNWNLFKEFHHKIIYRIVEDPIQSQRIWDHEDYLRDALFKSVFPGLTGTAQQANYGDVLVVSDMDEIIRPGAMLLLRHCLIPARLTLRTQFYYYSFQWRHRGPQWAHPDATLYRDSRTIMPNDLRQGLLEAGWAPVAAIRRWWDRGTLWNAGWHCSSCFATVAEMRTKMHSFSHQGWNTPKNRDLRTLIYRVQHGLDLFGRASELYDKVESNEDVPSYVSEQNALKGRFKYLLNRDGEDAGFEDISTVTPHDV
jgi:beta-1,4-mannosyl-glycoprotein beta-1,4-N-acetylglucosaminyltransferase